MNKNNFLKIILIELKRMISSGKTIFFLILSIGVMESIFLLGKTMWLENFFNSLNKAYEDGLGLRYVLPYFITLSLVIIIGDILNAINNYFLDKQIMVANAGIMKEFFSKINLIDILDFQKKEVLDNINKAKSGITSSIILLIKIEVIITSFILYFIIILIYLFKLHPLLSLTLFCIFIPSLISYKFKNKIVSETEDKIVQERRKMDAYESYIVDKQFFKETRHLNAYNFFIGKFTYSLNEFIYLSIQSFRKNNQIKLILNFFNFIGFLLIILILYYLVMVNIISIAEVGAVLATLMIIYSKMNELFNFQLSGISESYNGLYNLHSVLEYTKEEEKELMETNDITISIDNASFKYPNKEIETLKDINLDINPREVIAIVGENGSGKTTLSKLIAGIYKPTKGDVFYNGVSIEKLDLRSIYDNETIVFQDFKKYPLTVLENIRISDVNNADEERINDVLNELELNKMIGKLDKGADTLLSRELGGTDISIGEWQKLAIARSYYRKSSIFLFDEPTASLDPIQEIEIMEKFISLAKDKTTILITHRIGAARLADKIITMKNGEIVEIGTHDQLLKNKGEYLRLYDNQKQWYS